MAGDADDARAHAAVNGDGGNALAAAKRHGLAIGVMAEHVDGLFHGALTALAHGIPFTIFDTVPGATPTSGPHPSS